MAVEAAHPLASEAHVHEAVRVCEKLRISLARFVGPDGFTALMRRTLALARADVPSLQTVTVAVDERLEGIEELVSDAGVGVEAATTITAHLLGLLVVFIGESLTIRLVREIWPDASLEEGSRTRGF